MRKLIDIHTAELPVQWKRMRGTKTRYKPEDVRAWQEHLGDTAKDEISILGLEDQFPYYGHARLSIKILFGFERDISLSIDMDNIEKGILDALQGVLYPDDNIKYIRQKETIVDVAPCPAVVGSHVVMYAI